MTPTAPPKGVHDALMAKTYPEDGNVRLEHRVATELWEVCEPIGISGTGGYDDRGKWAMGLQKMAESRVRVIVEDQRGRTVRIGEGEKMIQVVGVRVVVVNQQGAKSGHSLDDDRRENRSTVKENVG